MFKNNIKKLILIVLLLLMLGGVYYFSKFRKQELSTPSRNPQSMSQPKRIDSTAVDGTSPRLEETSPNPLNGVKTLESPVQKALTEKQKSQEPQSQEPKTGEAKTAVKCPPREDKFLSALGGEEDAEGVANEDTGTEKEMVHLVQKIDEIASHSKGSLSKEGLVEDPSVACQTQKDMQRKGLTHKAKIQRSTVQRRE